MKQKNKDNISFLKRAIAKGDENRNYIEIDSGSLSEEKDIRDNQELRDATQKVFKDFKVQTIADGQTHSSRVLPLSIVSSSINTGYNQELNAFSDDIDIVDLHKDYSGDLPGSEAMQGPFAEKHVGGLAYRHHDLNTGSALHNFRNRREGFKIVVDTDLLTIQNANTTGPQTVDNNIPTADFFRDEVAKRPFNIKNIRKQNYLKDYEVISVGELSTNNKDFKMSGGIDPITNPSTVITGAVEYTKPNRARTEHIMITRFSAPGGPECAGDANGGPGLNVESGEYSVYNGLNYRNLIVRNAYNKLLTRFCGPFGTDSQVGDGVKSETYETSASFHKVNRNERLSLRLSGSLVQNIFVTRSVKDNWFINHAMPQQDIGYRWISASAESTVLGHATASEGDIVWASGSDVGSYYDTSAGERIYGVSKAQFDATGSGINFIRDNYVRMNYHIYEPITSSENHLGFPNTINWENINNRAYNTDFIDAFSGSSALYLNTILNKRYGIYEDPSWKYLRMTDHPVLQQNRKNNIESIIKEENPKIIVENGKRSVVKAMRSSNIKSFEISPVTVKYKPIVHSFIGKGEDDKEKELIVKHSYANNLSYFGEPEIDNSLNKLSNEKSPQIYDKLVSLYVTPSVDSPIAKFGNTLVYAETVYPRDVNVSLNKTRNRTQYDVTFWHDNRSERNQEGYLNSQGFRVSTSIWALDEKRDYTTALPVTGGGGYEGELQNNYTTFFGCGDYDQNYQPHMMGNYVTKVIRFNHHSESISGQTEGSSGDIPPYSPVLTEPSQYNEKIELTLPGALTWDKLIGNAGADDFTISAWINVTSAFSASISDQPQKQMIVSFGDDDRCFYLATGSSISTRELAFSASYTNAGAGSGAEWITTNSPIQQNAWNHVLCVFNKNLADSGKVKLYINSVINDINFFAGTTAGTLDDINTTGSVIGSGSVSSDSPSVSTVAPFEGMMADIAIFSGTLDDNEIIELYGRNQTSGTPFNLYTHSRANSLISWWRMGSGQSVFLNEGICQTLGDPSLRDAGYSTNDNINHARYDVYNNKIYDMVGENHGIPQGMSSSVNFTSSVGLVGRGEQRVTNWSNCLKPSPIYARKTLEYVGVPWPRRIISSSFGHTRAVRFTGSAIYAGDTAWSAPAESGKKPFYSSYEDYSSDIRYIGKEYSIIPEFIIDNHMSTYIDAGNFLADNEDFLSLTGSEIQSGSATDFYKTYSHSDFLQHFKEIKKDHEEVGKLDEISLECEAILKFLPYENFYPAPKTLQLAKLFSQSYGDFINPAGYGDQTASTGSWRAFLTPFFAPGILYNSIKAGIACDYPVYTNKPEIMEDYRSGVGGPDLAIYQDSPEFLNKTLILNRTSRGIYGHPYSASINQWNSQCNVLPLQLVSSSYHADLGINPSASDDYAQWRTVLSSKFDKRIPFNALVEPEGYLANSVIWDADPEYSASLRQNPIDSKTSQGAFWNGEGSEKFKLAMHNFLAEVPNFFLEDGKFTTFASKPISTQGIEITKETANKYFGMDIVMRNSECKSLTDYYIRRTLNKYSDITDIDYRIDDHEMNDLKGIHTMMYERDSAFGPPWVCDNLLFTSSQTGLSYHYSYEPFTPAYYNGFGQARLLFKPFKGVGNYTLDEIQNNTKVYYTRFPTNRTGSLGVYLTDQIMEWQTMAGIDENLAINLVGRPNLLNVSANVLLYRPLSNKTPAEVTNFLLSSSANWQQLSSSIEIFAKTKVKKVIYEKGEFKDFVPASIEDDSNADELWVIQPKWETPILNFKHTSATSASSNAGTGSAARGMWHQYGQNPSKNTGIWLSINDIPNTKLNSEGLAGLRSYGDDITGLFKNRSENIFQEKKENARVQIYIRDSGLLGSSAIILDGATLTEGVSWTAKSTNLGTAQSILRSIVIDAGTLTSDLFPEKGLNLSERFTGSAYIPNEYPFAENVNQTGSAGPVAVVDLVVKDTLGVEVVADPFDALYNSTVHSTHPEYFASDEIGNKVQISVDSDITAMAVYGRNENEKLVLATDVKFYGGKANKFEVKSLADLLGFEKQQKKLGKIVSEKKIWEAVVAIPFIEENNEKKFFSLSRREIDLALGKQKQREGEELPGESIVDMVDKMQKYVIPPKMNFIDFDQIDPFAMYIFEFSHTLTKQDLIDIWQNLQPEIGRSFKKQTVSISHKLLQNEFMRGEINDHLRWMVFKVKQKASINYFAKTADQSDDDRFKFKFNVGESVPKYSYNWPYSDFSLVELVKMTSKVKITGK